MSLCKKCNAPHKTSIHPQIAYQKRNKEKVNAATHKWGTTHREQATEIRRKYRQTENGRARQLTAIKNYEASNPERKKAWVATRKFPKKPCIECGDLPTHKHHPDINKPLEITYLCPLHHKRIHTML